MKKYHVQKGDAVVVNAGKWKGESATVEVVLTKNDRVVLKLADLNDEKRKKIGMRTVKKTRKNQTAGGMIERSVSVHVSNVTLTPEAKQAKLDKKAALQAKKSQARAAAAANGVK